MSQAVQRGIATLEMDLEGPAPEGAVTSTEGTRLAFSGWTELAAAIEKWRADARVQAKSAPRAWSERDRVSR